MVFMCFSFVQQKFVGVCVVFSLEFFFPLCFILSHFLHLTSGIRNSADVMRVVERDSGIEAFFQPHRRLLREYKGTKTKTIHFLTRRPEYY